MCALRALTVRIIKVLGRGVDKKDYIQKTENESNLDYQ